MKIKLVLPAAETLRISSKSSEVPKRAMLRFSVLPLTTVAALTPDEHEVTLVDENVEPIDFGEEVDVVGVTFMTSLAPRAYEIARKFKKRNVVTVAGGYHPTFCPEEAAKYFDAVVIGEAEGSWQRVLADAGKNAVKKFYANDAPCNPADIPVPRRELTGKTKAHYVTTNAVQSGRGCVHGCRYCSITAFHKKTFRARPVETVVSEIKNLRGNFMFVDDNIISDPDYARELFTALIPLRKKWVSQCSIKIADHPDLLTLARRSGCVGLFVGIETMSAKNLRQVKKEFNDAAGCVEKIARIKAAGIGITAGMIVGLDADTPRVFQDTLEFLDTAGIDTVQINILTPLPGTPMFDDFKKAGRMIDFDWSHYDFRHVVFSPGNMTGQQLKDGADWLYSRFYSLSRILHRTIRAFFALGPLQAYLVYRLNMTYRYDNLREGIRGRNPARQAKTVSLLKKIFKFKKEQNAA